jgi:phosphoglycolate phosphatase-like HAD superfamily hydrolase
MLRRAARKHGVDLSASWMVGDIEADIEAGRRAGARTILVGPETAQPPPDYRAQDFVMAVRHILAVSGNISESAENVTSFVP